MFLESKAVHVKVSRIQLSPLASLLSNHTTVFPAKHKSQSACQNMLKLPNHLSPVSFGRYGGKHTHQSNSDQTLIFWLWGYISVLWLCVSKWLNKEATLDLLLVRNMHSVLFWYKSTKLELWIPPKEPQDFQRYKLGFFSPGVAQVTDQIIYFISVILHAIFSLFPMNGLIVYRTQGLKMDSFSKTKDVLSL